MIEKKKMTYDEALEYIHGISWTFCKPGLERITELCKRLGNPQDSLKFIHVAGTNGKGSFCSMLDSVLREAGYSVGLYTSPYILRFNERMRVDGEDIPDSELAEITEYVRPIADSMVDKPTEFELITAICFEFFKRRGVDVVVLECGMGGRLDSTNVIKTPLLSVITGIAIDHASFLGDTVEKIAYEKAGIIKPGIPTLLGTEDKAIVGVVSEVCAERDSALTIVYNSDINVASYSPNGSVFRYKEREGLEVELLGTYQPVNASRVVEAVDILRREGLEIPESALRIGLKKARWRARFEKINENPLVIYDGAHNPEGIDAAVKSCKTYFGDEKVLLLTGVMADKDYDYIATRLAEAVKKAYTITADNPRALPAEKYAQVLRTKGVEANPYPRVREALYSAMADAKRDGEKLVIFGSLYTYCEVDRALKELK